VDDEGVSGVDRQDRGTLGGENVDSGVRSGI
jgi:hypothetical protein